jgi:hypothetical protein
VCLTSDRRAARSLPSRRPRSDTNGSTPPIKGRKLWVKRTERAWASADSALTATELGGWLLRRQGLLQGRAWCDVGVTWRVFALVMLSVTLTVTGMANAASPSRGEHLSRIALKPSQVGSGYQLRVD